MSGEIPKQESVWRSAVFPLAFKVRQKQLSPKSLFKLHSSDTAPFVLEMSLARQKFAPTMEMIHRFGCRLAAFQNRVQSRNGKKTDRIYCGSYELRAGSLPNLQGVSSLAEVKTVQVIHCVENGEFAHANLRIEVDTNGDVEAVEEVKTLIVDQLWRQSSGPEKYICLRDERVQSHPSDWLADAPRGSYTEQRSTGQIALDFLAYAVLHFPRLWVIDLIQRVKAAI